MSEDLATITKFKRAFLQYLGTINSVELPSEIKNIDDFQFTVYFTKYVKPYKGNWDEGYINLKEFLTGHGVTVPELNEEQKKKVKLYLEAITEVLDS